MARSAKDNENANARPSRIGTTRTKSVLGGGATATSATTRATASTAASKAKVVSTDTVKDEKDAGVKRKREVLVEVTGLVSNNKLKASGTVTKGKEPATTENIEKPAVVAKSKVTVKPPSRRLAGAVAPKRLVARAGSETKSVPKAEAEKDVAEGKPSMAAIAENMEVDAKAHDEEEADRAHKRRHTDEKPVVHAKVLDDSQVEADVVANQLQAVEPSPANEQKWDDLDAEDWDDPLMVSEYVADVCIYLKEIEVRISLSITELTRSHVL